jgi:hypothetical protein
MPNGIRRFVRDLLLSSPQIKLAHKLPIGGVGMEIGVWKGDYSRHLLRITKPHRLYLVDPWECQPDFANTSYGGTGVEFRDAAVRSQEDMEALYQKVEMELGRLPAVSVLRMKSSDLSGRIGEGELDWIYIDGNHTYEFVRDDLHLAWGLVKENGVISGDDFNARSGPCRFGVRTALLEFCNEKDRRLSVIGNSQWMFTR